MRRRSFPFFILLACLLLGACLPASPATQTEPTMTSPPPVTEIPSPTATATPSPEPTPAPTLPLPTLDPVNAVAPVETWLEASLPNGVRFLYPANWHLWLDEDNDRTVILNAAPDSVIAIKGYADDLMRIELSHRLYDIPGYPSLMAYLEENVLKNLPEDALLLLEELPATPQGYQAVRVVHLQGMSEDDDIYLSDGQRLLRVHTFYVPGKRTGKTYLYMLPQIAERIVLPPQE